MLLSPPHALGSPGQVLSGRLLRLSQSAAYRTSGGVASVPGFLHGPANTMGELTLGSNTSLTMQAFRAVVPNSQDPTQGAYTATNDAAVTLTTATTPAMPVQDATQFRRALIAVIVADAQVAGVASTATTDRAYLDIIPGALAATAGAAVLPAAPANTLLAGELLIPPTGQTVTLTAYNPRTTIRGGLLGVITDGANVSGHDGYAGLYDGEPRWHPLWGKQTWSAALAVWVGQSGPLPTFATRAALPAVAGMWEGARANVTSKGTVYRVWNIGGSTLKWAAEKPYAIARVTASAALQSTTAGDQAIPWPVTAQYDTDNMWSTPALTGPSGRFIAPIPGIYRVTNHLVVQAAAGITVAARLGTAPPTASPYVSGNPNASDSRTVQATNGDDHRHAVAEIPMNAGDSVNGTAYNSAGAVTISSAWGGSYCSIEYLGPQASASNVS